MIKFYSILSPFLITVFFFLVQSTVVVHADDSAPCMPIYGGGCLIQSQAQAQIVNITNPVPAGSVGIGTSGQIGQVLGITELPKTGVPTVALALSGLFIPAGFLLRKFAAHTPIDEENKEHAGYIWQMREFMKGSED